MDTALPNKIDADNIPDIVRNTMSIDDLNRIKSIDRKKGGLYVAKQLINAIPWAGGVINGEIDVAMDIRDANFFRNYIAYLYGLNDTTEEQRQKFLEEVEKTAEDYSGNVIAGMISRIDNINKGEILSNLTKAKISGAITIEDFFRIWNAVERIPYSDFKYLPTFQEDNYLEGGVTEILYASGVIFQSIVGAEPKFRLSSIGVNLLVYGLYQQVTISADNRVSVRPEWE